MWEFSGLACKTHIAHIAHIARSPGSVEVQRVPADEVEDAGSYVSEFFSMVRPTGPGKSRFSMVRPTGLRGRGRFFFNGSPNGPGRGFGFFFSMVRPTGPGGVSFFNGPPNGPGRGFGFFFQWSAQRVCGVGVGFFSMVRPTGPGGVSDFFFNGPPNGPGRGFGFSFFNGPPNGSAG